MKLGYTISRSQCDWLDLEYPEVMSKLSKTPLKLVRHGLYWDEIEEVEREYNFDLAKEEILESIRLGNEIILTIGCKSPRYPEYYVPKFLEDKLDYRKKDFAINTYVIDRLLNFIERAIEEFKDFKEITAWHVENEPLDPSGPSEFFLSEKLLQKEIDLVYSLDNSREIIINAWGNDLKKRKTLKKLKRFNYVNTFGFDFYPRQSRGFFNTYKGPDLEPKQILSMREDIEKSGRKAIITELQAEPWEEFDYRKQSENIQSISLEKIKSNFDLYKDLGFSSILFWGVEYWIWAGIFEEVMEILGID
jgi:hypothetical protein